MKFLKPALQGIVVSLFLVATGFAQTDNTAMLADWNETAERAEQVLEVDLASTRALETLRGDLVDQRSEALTLIEASQAQIAPLREELDLLGPAPSEGAVEATEISGRRGELEKSIALETVPLLVAQAAYSRSDGLIKEINAVIRVRFSEKLIEVGPSPIDPGIWPAAFGDFNYFISRIIGEIADTFEQDASRAALADKAPLALIIAGLGLWMLLGVRRGFADVVKRALAFGGEVTLWQSALADLTRLLVPGVGAAALIFAIRSSDVVGIWGGAIVEVLPYAAFALIAAPWLGRSVFGGAGDAVSRSGVNLSMLLGVVYAAYTLLEALSGQGDFMPETQAVLGFPLILLAALAFYRLSRVLGMDTAKHADQTDEDGLFIFSGFLSRLLFVFSIAAPLFAAAGYFAASRFIVFPTIVTLAFLAALLVLFDLIRAFLDYWIEVVR